MIRALRRLVRAVHEYSKAVLHRTGISGPQLWALSLLDASPGLSLRELSAQMFAHPSTVSGVVDRLVRRGAVRRETNRRDRRGIHLFATAQGRRWLRNGPSPVQEDLLRALRALSSRRLRSLRLTLEAVAATVDARRRPPPFLGAEESPRSPR